jgi:hypothetical protein
MKLEAVILYPQSRTILSRRSAAGSVSQSSTVGLHPIEHHRFFTYLCKPCDRKRLSTKETQNTEGNQNMHMIPLTLIMQPMLAAIGYSFMYLLGGGGLFGAIVIFIIFKMLRK